VQIILDATAPAGIRVHASKPALQADADDFVRDKLEIPRQTHHHANDNQPPRQTSFTAAELQHMDFPPPKWIVKPYVAEGCTLFAGRPKIGKSWLERFPFDLGHHRYPACRK
jgi:hypothetical protein